MSRHQNSRESVRAGAKPQPEAPGELSQVQRWFQAVITNAEGVEAGAASEEAQRLLQIAPNELERVITRSRALTAAERVAIYANAYHSRLIECLADVFPMLKRTLGEDGFDALAFGYLQESPSRSYTLNELGRRFPEYLEQTRPRDEQGTGENGNWAQFLVDLARLEWAIYEVFDGPGVEGQALLRAEEILAIPGERWPEARLVPVVCLTFVSTRFPVNDYFTGLRKIGMDEMLPMPAAADSFVALTRRDFVVRRYNLAKTEFELLKAIKNGFSIGQAVEALAGSAGGSLKELAANLQLWFRNWTAEGFFKSVSLGASRS